MFGKTSHIYDLIYEASGKDYAAESQVIHEVVQDRKAGARTLLDVACGTGGHLRHLRHWYAVTGIDADPAMLAEAREHLPGETLVVADMRDFRLGARFDAVTCLFSSIGYLADTSDLERAVGTMAAHLNPGGVLIIDGWVRPDAWRDGEPAHVEIAASGSMKVVRVTHSRRRGRATSLEMHHIVATQEGIEHVVENHDLTLFAPEQYEAALEAAALGVEVIESPMPGRDRYVGIRNDHLR